MNSDHKNVLTVSPQFCPNCSPHTWGSSLYQSTIEYKQCASCGYLWEVSSPHAGCYPSIYSITTEELKAEIRRLEAENKTMKDHLAALEKGFKEWRDKMDELDF